MPPISTGVNYLKKHIIIINSSSTLSHICTAWDSLFWHQQETHTFLEDIFRNTFAAVTRVYL